MFANLAEKISYAQQLYMLTNKNNIKNYKVQKVESLPSSADVTNYCGEDGI